MSETIYHRYRLKRRTTAGWAANNEVLLAGEPGIEVLVDGTERIKYGDGVKTWAQLSYAAGGGGGAALSNATPQALGTAAAGTSAEASRADHRHQLPTAGDVGADASGTAAAAVAAHAAAADPHPGYALETDARLSDARPPTAHKSTHATGGTDALSPADIGAATAAQGAKADTAVQPAGLTKAAVGLGNADNTSDVDKPVSTATAAALGGKAGTGAIGSSGLTMATARLLGRTTAGAGAVEEIQVSGGTFTNGVLTLPGSSVGTIGPSRTIFAARLQSTTTPEVPSSGSGIVTTFLRNFDATVLSSADGIYSNVGHATAGFSFIRSTGRSFLQGSTDAANVIATAGTEHRDLTLSSWVKTNATAAKTSTGIDGTVNSASNLTATADAATCLFTTTAAAATRTFQPFIRRRAGFGRVWITVNNGASWTDVTSQIGKPGGIYRRVDVQATAANPTCGFRLEYSGDAIDVDSAVCILSAYPILPLLNRGFDVKTSSLTYAGAKPTGLAIAFKISATVISDSQGSIGFGLYPSSGNGLIGVQILPSAIWPLIQLIGQSGTIIYNGTPRYTLNNVTLQAEQVVRIEILYAGGAVYGYINEKLSVIYDAQTPATHDVSGFTDLRLNVPNNCLIGNLQIDEWTGRIVTLLGDSISAGEGYTRAWLGAMPDSVILNKGVGGDRVANVLARVSADMAYALPSTSMCDVVIWVGTNSLADGISPAAALADLQSTVNAIKAINTNARVTLVTTITNRTTGFSGGVTTGSFLTAAQTYNTGLASIAGVRKVVEINGIDMGVDTSTTTFIRDGIHPFDHWYSRMVQKIATAIL